MVQFVDTVTCHKARCITDGRGACTLVQGQPVFAFEFVHAPKKFCAGKNRCAPHRCIGFRARLLHVTAVFAWAFKEIWDDGALRSEERRVGKEWWAKGGMS